MFVLFSERVGRVSTQRRTTTAMKILKSKLICLFIVLSFLCNGCATPKLWEATNPNDNIRMKYTEVNEEDLKAQGVKYIKDDRMQSYYIEKDLVRKYQDYTCRVIGTPITVALDAALALFILIGQGSVDDAKDRGHEAEATKNGYRTESFPLPRNPYPK
jgi:hypothetical protein